MRVNEIFYSIQGEGRFTGTPAIFIRFAGCNLNCNFCDTEYKSYKEYTEDEIMLEIAEYPTRHVVITGGEPMLQLTVSLMDKLHKTYKFVQIETNGTWPIRKDFCIDWITCSPKFDFCPNAELKLQCIDELKVVYQGQDMSVYNHIEAKEYYLQPCDVKDHVQNKANVSATINYIKMNPKWKLSLQTHKILNVR